MLTADTREHGELHRVRMKEAFEMIMARLRESDFPTHEERLEWFRFQDWEAKHGVLDEGTLATS